MALSLAEVREEMTEKQRQMHVIYDEAGPTLDMDKVKYITGTTSEKVAEIQKRQRELDDLGQQHDRLYAAEMALKSASAAYADHQYRERTPAGSPPLGETTEEKTAALAKPGAIRRMLMEHKGYQAFRGASHGTVTIDIPVLELKNLIALTGINVQPQRIGFQPMALEERTVSDLMMQGETDNNTIEYYEETAFTNDAVEVAEGASKPESDLTYTLRTEPVRKIAHWIPATKEALDDVPFLESQIRGRLAFGITRREEQQILTGDGTAPNISGITDRSGIQTQAKGTDPTPDAIYKAMQLIRGSAGLGFAEPSAVVIHPADWTDIKLLRTADGIYLWGNPSEEGPDRIWGLPVRQTTGMTANTALVGAFRTQAEVFRRSGIEITLSTEHSTYFIENKVAILAESRLALAVYRPAAFATVTGI